MSLFRHCIKVSLSDFWTVGPRNKEQLFRLHYTIVHFLTVLNTDVFWTNSAPNPCSSVCPGSPSSTSTPRPSSSRAWCCSPSSAPQRQQQRQRQQRWLPRTWTTTLPIALTPPQDWSSTPTPPRRRPPVGTSATASPLLRRCQPSQRPRPLRPSSIPLWLLSPLCLPPRRLSSTTLCTRPTVCSE